MEPNVGTQSREMSKMMLIEKKDSEQENRDHFYEPFNKSCDNCQKVSMLQEALMYQPIAVEIETQDDGQEVSSLSQLLVLTFLWCK